MSNSNEVITMDSVNLDNVPKLLAQVKEKLKAYSASDEEVHKNILDTQLGSIGKLKNIKKISSVIKAASVLEAKKDYFNSALKSLDVDSKKYSFKYEGFSYNQWIEAMKSRISRIQNVDKIEKLHKTKSILEKHLSKEDKFKKDMQDIVGLLKEDLDER